MRSADRWLLPVLLTGIAIVALASLCTGAVRIGIDDLLRGWDGLDSLQRQALALLRLPRVLMGILTGSALAVSGALMQTYFRNPLAEPYVTGVSAGGALGAVAAQSAGASGALLLAGSALAGSTMVTAALLAFARRLRHGGPMGVLLLGVALGTFCGALIWLGLLGLGPGASDAAIGWLLGRVSTVGYAELSVLAPLWVAGMLWALRLSPRLDSLLLGEEKAATLGVDLPSIRRGVLGSAMVLAGSCVAFCGVIAFVGLIVPHIMRSFVGSLHSRLLPACAAAGSLLVLTVDLASRTFAPPREIPLTIIMSLLGAPFFIYVLLRGEQLR